MKSFLAVVGGIFLIPILIILGAFIQGFVLYKACLWYFPIIGLHFNLSFYGSVAVMLIVGIFRPLRMKNEQQKKGEVWYELAGALIGPWITLLVLWGFTFIL